MYPEVDNSLDVETHSVVLGDRSEINKYPDAILILLFQLELSGNRAQSGFFIVQDQCFVE